MANCPNCGEQVKTGTNFCIVCGESLDSVVETVIPEVSKKNAITSFVLGIVAARGVILSMFPYICFIFFPIFLILSILGMNKARQYKKESGKDIVFSKIGRIVSNVTFFLSIIFFFIGIFLSFMPGTAAAFWDGVLSVYGF